MIRHSILFKVKQDASRQMVQNAIENLCALKNKLPGIINMMGGECNFVNEKSTGFFADFISHCISIDFTDKAAYDAFLKNPITVPAKNDIVKVTERGYDGIIGLDFIE